MSPEFKERMRLIFNDPEATALFYRVQDLRSGPDGVEGLPEDDPAVVAAATRLGERLLEIGAPP